MPAVGANARLRQSANTPREPFLRTSCACRRNRSLLYNDSFRWLVTRVRRINWSCYSVAARRDPNPVLVRGYNPRGCEQWGLQKACRRRATRRLRLAVDDVINIASFCATLRCRYAPRFSGALSPLDTGVENHFYGSMDR